MYQRPNIARMTGYASGEQPHDPNTIKLNTNENPYPPSPKVDAALAALRAEALRRYPQPTADTLRKAIAAHHGVAMHNVVITNGGDEALRLAFSTFVEPGAAFGTSDPSYSLYPVLAGIQDARVIEVPLGDDWSLPEDFAAQLNEAGAQLTCLVNPHAPSGNLLACAALADLAQQLNGVLLIDEAYADFVHPQCAYDSTHLIEKHDNVLILRTFSKGYSLAGLRLGYLLGPAELIQPILTKTRDSYNIDHISQVLGLAAFTDQEYARNTWQAVREQRTLLRQNLGQLGLTAPESQTNFLLVTIPHDAILSAQEVYTALKSRGILVRYFSTPRLHDKLRITVGTPDQNQQLIEQLTALLQP